MREHDAIVIGAGPAGEVCASSLAREGLDVAIVERELVGGECAYWACMPSKALLRPGELLAEVQRVPGARETRTRRLEPPLVLARRDEVIHRLNDAGQLQWLEDHDIRLVRGAARLEGERRVRVGDDLLQARRAVVIAVGSGPAIPPIPGLERSWTSRAGTTAETVPRRLIVLGGGAVGCELAQAWSSLGAEVTLVEAHPRVLPDEEPFVGDLLQASLRAQGVAIRCDAEVTSVHRASDSTTVTLATGEDLTADELLVAVGRVPHTGDLGLETVGLTPGETIPVDDRLRVPGHDWLYAVGDVNGRALLTHAAKYQALVATATIMDRPAEAVWDGPLSPRVVFTEPEVAAVGQTLQQALDAGVPARAVDVEIGSTAGASFVGRDAPSRARIVVDERREVVVGATLCGPAVAEILHSATIAIVGEVPLRRLIHAMPAFPTRSEIWVRLLRDWVP